MPATENNLDAVLAMAADVLGVPAGSISAASGPDSIEAWDSVAHLNLIMAAEERFGVSLEPDDIEGVHSIGELAAAIERRRR